MLTVVMMLTVIPAWAVGESEVESVREIATELVYAAPFEYITPGVYFDREAYSEEIVPFMNTTVRFWDDRGNILREVMMWSGTPISPALVPVPAIRHGVPGIPGQAFMGWFTAPNPSHYINNPNRPQPFNLSQPIWSTGVFNLFGSWLQYGDVNGDGVIGAADSLLLRQFMVNPTLNIIRQTADVNADGVISGADSLLLQQFMVNPMLVLGPSNPANTVTLTFNSNGGTPVAQTRQAISGTTLSNMPNNPQRAGHSFVGWFNTSAATGGTQFTSTSIIPNVNTTYWARWTPTQSLVTLTFNANGGSPITQTRQRVSGTVMGADMPIVQRAGHSFVGWFNTSAATGGTQFTANSTVPNVNTTYWARWRQPSRHLFYAQIRYDDSHMAGRLGVDVERELRQVFEDATWGFLDIFDIELRLLPLTGILANPSTLNGHCPYTELHQLCLHDFNRCGTRAQCPTHHHKSGTRLHNRMAAGVDPNLFVIGVVGHRLCAYSPGNHYDIDGISNNEGRTSVSSSMGGDLYIAAPRDLVQLTLTIQHELTHNIGGMRDEGCTPGEPCVIGIGVGNSVLNEWCTRCYNYIRAAIGW